MVNNSYKILKMELFAKRYKLPPNTPPKTTSQESQVKTMISMD